MKINQALTSVVFTAMMILSVTGQAAEGFTRGETPAIVISDSSMNFYQIGRHFDILEDASRSLTIQDITMERDIPLRWKRSNSDAPGFGFTRSAYWLRFRIENPGSTAANIYLENTYPLLDHLDLYKPDVQGRYTVRKSGDQLPFASRDVDYRNFVFSIMQPPKSINTYYFRSESTTSMNLQFFMSSPEIFQKRTSSELPLLWLYYGLLISMIVLNFLISFSVKDYCYYYYVGYIALYMVLQMALNGLAYEYLWPNLPVWQNYSIPLLICLAFAAGNQFARLFMQTHRTAPRWDKVIIAMIALSAVGIVITLAVDYSLGVKFSTALMSGSVILLTVSVILTVKGVRTARFYLASWSFFIVGVFAFAMKSLGIMPVNLFTNWSIQIGSTLQVIILAFALSDKISAMNRELKELNVNLETRVTERTEELTVARDALWGEMQLAKKIQTVLLPVDPAITGFEITGYMKPADEVGGDYYDIINAGGLDWIVIGDVSGHGIPAGLIMMMVQTSIHTVLLSNPELQPSELLARVNHVITENIKRLSEDKYMTITVLACHMNGAFHFSGLHQDILVYRVKSGKTELVETSGMWIGIVDDISSMVDDFRLSLDPGDTMLLYTDGITEAWKKGSIRDARDPVMEMFGEDRLIEIFSRCGNESSLAIKDAIVAELDQYECNDDITMVVVRRLT